MKQVEKKDEGRSRKSAAELSEELKPAALRDGGLRLFSLDERLSAAASLVPKGARIADIGAGHGKLAISLLKTGRIRSAILSDLSEKALSQARLQHKRHLPELPVCFFVSDGLSHLSKEDCDTIVIAGMGGGTIAEILEGASFPLKNHRLILQPMSSPEDLRRFLYVSGIGIAEERLVLDGGRLYLLILSPGEILERPELADIFLGRGHEKSPFFETHRRSVLKRLEGMKKGALLNGEKALCDEIEAAYRKIESMECDGL